MKAMELVVLLALVAFGIALSFGLTWISYVGFRWGATGFGYTLAPASFKTVTAVWLGLGAVGVGGFCAKGKCDE